ncbi:hypothetical protein [Botryobacter ruber]|uniref:hypothetical protein n=1 Tax=Botryobacter ruber TaxID=2171629 RepID=UPI000E0A0670|nr:hypothetical protein [Botryobacter ruber]
MDFSKVILKEALFIDASIKRERADAANEVRGFSSQVSVNPSFVVSEKKIKIDVHVTCEAVDDAIKSVGINGFFHLEFIFIVDNIEEHLITAAEGDKVLPSPALMVPLIGAAYSTARGMIIVKALGTSLQGFTLPIVNVQDLLQPAKSTPTKRKPKKSSEQQ